ncbi:MAG: hypothetical protein ABIR24_04550 [Verrucomicrobiota bacterium]
MKTFYTLVAAVLLSTSSAFAGLRDLPRVPFGTNPPFALRRSVTVTNIVTITNIVTVTNAVTNFAPSSLVGLDIGVFVSDGASPFLECGAYHFMALNTTSYILVTTCGNSLSSGTYNYQKKSAVSGVINFTDSITGAGGTQTINFRNPLCGSYSITNATQTGFQVGNFLILNQ